MPDPASRLISFEPEPQALRDVPSAIARSQEFLLGCQHPDGYWQGELEVDATLCCDTILFLHWSGRNEPDLQQRCADHIRRRQIEDGGWNIFVGGPSEINASVKAYFALKLAGDSPHSDWMREARANILRLGGIPQMNTYGRLYLALLGQFPWEFVPTIPPEIFLLRRGVFFNIYEMSAWSRTIIAPLAILNHFKPVRPLAPALHIHELYPAGMEKSDLSLKKDPRFWAWRNFFLRCDAGLKLYNQFPFHPLRQRALKAAESWMTERMGEGCDGLSAIFPAMLNAMMALRVLGYADDHPLMVKAWNDFTDLFVEDSSDFRIQPCLSPVWDTAITTVALGESGLEPAHPCLQRAAHWLEDREIRFRGDWAVRLPHVEPSGWAFEHHNKFYPDTDDTMMVLMALRLVEPADSAARLGLVQRALNWLLAFQCRDGGWAAFDKNVTALWLEHVPFADHNAILDPTCSDLTARMLELLGALGHDPNSPAIRRAVTMLRHTQEADGSWYGRWGVNYLYGTWQALRGLAAIGTNMEDEWIRRARDWLESCQNEDGGWGETCESYTSPALKGRGPSTASQSAWALMGLCACGDPTRGSIRRGIQWLVNSQNSDGSWSENATTGTGFPGVFYLKYDMYRNHFPLLALATFEQIR